MSKFQEATSSHSAQQSSLGTRTLVSELAPFILYIIGVTVVSLAGHFLRVGLGSSVFWLAFSFFSWYLIIRSLTWKKHGFSIREASLGWLATGLLMSLQVSPWISGFCGSVVLFLSRLLEKSEKKTWIVELYQWLRGWLLIRRRSVLKYSNQVFLGCLTVFCGIAFVKASQYWLIANQIPVPRFWKGSGESLLWFLLGASGAGLVIFGINLRMRTLSAIGMSMGILSFGMFKKWPTLEAWVFSLASYLAGFYLSQLFWEDEDESNMPPVAARTMSAAEFYEQAEYAKNVGCFYFFKDIRTGEDLFYPKKFLWTHWHYVGGTGSGKTSAVLCPAYQGMIHKMNVFYISGKPSDVTRDKFFYLANRSGRAKELCYLDIWEDWRNSHTINFIECPSEEGKSALVMRLVMRSIGMESPVAQIKSQDFYIGGQEFRLGPITDLFLALKKPFVGEDYFYFLNDKRRREHALQLAEANGARKLAEEVREMMDNLPQSKGGYGAMDGVRNYLAKWTKEPFKDLVNDPYPDIKMLDLLRDGGLFYCALYPGAFPQQSIAICRNILDQIFIASEVLRRNNKETLIILDEVQAMLVPFFDKMLAQLREKRIGIVIAHQNLSQLMEIEGVDKRVYYDNVVSSTLNKAFFSCVLPDDGDKMSKIFGLRRGKKRSYSMSKRSTGGTSVSESVSEGEEFIIHPDWFRNTGKQSGIFALKSPLGIHVVRGPDINIEGVKVPLNMKPRQKKSSGGALNLREVSDEEIQKEAVQGEQKQREKHKAQRKQFDDIYKQSHGEQGGKEGDLAPEE